MGAGQLDDRDVQGWFQRGSADLAPSSESEGPSMVEWLLDALLARAPRYDRGLTTM